MEKVVTRVWRTYNKYVPEEDMDDFMYRHQDWNLINFSGGGHYLKDEQELPDGTVRVCAKDLAVEGTDGIIYSGVMEAVEHSDKGKPTLTAHFVLGRNQRDTKGLDEKMESLGFNIGIIHLTTRTESE